MASLSLSAASETAKSAENAFFVLGQLYPVEEMMIRSFLSPSVVALRFWILLFSSSHQCALASSITFYARNEKQSQLSSNDTEVD